MSEAFTRRYRLIERLAIGGTAEVFRAVFDAYGAGEKPVVIKRVLPQLARDERFRRLFFEEACLAATLSHPNIVKVLDYGDLGDTCFIAMERIDGQDLESLLTVARSAATSGPLVPAALAALIAVDVGDALQFIHRHTSSEGLPLQIIHRDVSPHNILVSYQGEVKLTDFGIAKSVIRREHTVDGTIRGKLDYMAPEQALPEQPVDHRADLFALGCVLYEMLHGIPPLRGCNEIDTLERLRDFRMDVPPGQLEAPEPLRRVLARLLRASPAERYDQARDVVADLRAYLQTVTAQPTQAELGQWASRLRERTRADNDERAVDEAVRALLGDPGADIPDIDQVPDQGTRQVNTSVFATTSNPGGLDVNVERQARVDLAFNHETLSPEITSQAPIYPTRKARQPWKLIVGLATLGLLGWLLWGLRVLEDHIDSRQPARTISGAETSPSDTDRDADERRSGATTPAAPDQRRGARRHATNSAAKARPNSVVRRETGLLTVNSLPWSRVYLDGYYVGNTPLIEHEVRTGDRLVELRGPDGNLRKSFQATVTQGETGKYTFDFRPPDGGTRGSD